MTPSDYIRRGWAVVPIPPEEKGPKLQEWQKRLFTAADFASDNNVGIKLGRVSGSLVDIDLDCLDALALADIYLPPSSAIFDRASKPRSHRPYIAPDAAFPKFADPISGDMLLELRADGDTGGVHQTLFPPSIADNEKREWHSDTIAPVSIDARVLMDRRILPRPRTRKGSAGEWLAHRRLS